MNAVTDKVTDSENVKGTPKKVPRPASKEAVKDIIAISKQLDEQMQIASGHQVWIDKLREGHSSLRSDIKQLQQFVQEDGETLEDIIEKHNKVTEMIETLYHNLQTIQSMVEKMAAQEPDEDPEWSILGIEAKKSTWKKILKSVAAAICMVGVSYYAYKKLNQTSPNKANLAVTM